MSAGARTPRTRRFRPVPLGAVCCLALLILQQPRNVMSQEGQAIPGGRPEWRLLAEGNLARLEAEPVLYRGEDESQCLVRLRVTNVAIDTIGVSMAGDPFLVFLNQWSTSHQPRRMVIDELELPRTAITTEERQLLLGAYQAGDLVAIPPQKSTDFWRAFSGRCPNDGAVPPGHYLILSLSGRLRTTDGKRIEELTLLGAEPESRDLALRPPLQWLPLPMGARRIPP